MNEYEKYVEVFKVIQRKGGAVYKTQSEGMKWVNAREKPPRDYIYASPSSSYEGQTFRRINK